MRINVLRLSLVGLVALAACGGDSDGSDATSTTTSTASSSTTTTTVATTTTTVQATTTTLDAANVATAEQFIDAFYSFDSEELEANMQSAQTSQGFILFYQGWAEGANYRIVERQPCRAVFDDLVRCPVTVEDDFAKTLDFGFDVTDSYAITFENGAIVSVETSSDDPPLMGTAFDWMFENKPDLFEDGQACDGFFGGGPTPGECAAAFVVGFEEFINSDN